MKYFFLIALFFVITLPAYADISLLLHEAKGFSGETTGAGHSAVFLSDVCADPPPFVLRDCRNQENRGAVMVTYPGFGAANDYKWFAMPLIPYLYGVEKAEQIPLYANGEIRLLLRETVRQRYLSDVVPRDAEGKLPPGRWVEIIGAGLNRDLYAFTVRSTPEQDEKFIAKYSLLVKGNDFNAFSRNCADFTKEIMNMYFPNSSRRDVINDFGMTTPKAITRSFTNYAKKRPDLMFHVTKFPQLDGTILRSFGNRNFTETAFTSKKYYVTQALTMPILFPLFSGSYFLTGYFNIDKTYRKYPSVDLARLYLQKRLNENRLNFDDNTESVASIESRITDERNRIFGREEDWKAYRASLEGMLAKAIQQKLFLDKHEVKSFFRDLEFQSEPFFDANGHLMLRVDNYGTKSLLGLTRTNILAPETDTRLAYKLMLVKLKAELEAPKKNRETFDVLQSNWALLLELQKRSDALPPFENPTNARFQSNPVEIPGSKKFVKLFRDVMH